MVNNNKIQERIQKFIEEIDILKTKDSFSEEFKKWEKELDSFFIFTLGEKTKIVQEYDKILFKPIKYNINLTAEIYRNYYSSGLDQALDFLKTLRKEVSSFNFAQENQRVSTKLQTNDISVFIGSSLDSSYLIFRKEIQAALKRRDITGISWEKDRPGGTKIPDGEEYMIKQSIACVFLLGNKSSPGTLDEYKIAKKLGKLIILVDLTPIEGKQTADMDPLLKSNIWNPSREKGKITIEWTQSDDVVNKIWNGIDAKFPNKFPQNQTPNIELIVKQTQVTKEQNGVRLNYSIHVKNKSSDTISDLIVIMTFDDYSFIWNTTIDLSPSGTNKPENYRWSRVNDSQYRLKCLTKRILPQYEEYLGGVQLLLPKNTPRISFSCMIYCDKLEKPSENTYLIKGFLERLQILRIT